MSSYNPADALRIIQEHVFRSYEGQAEVEAWRNLPEIPSSSEIINSSPSYVDIYGDLPNENIFGCNSVDLVENIIDGPWGSVSQYVRSHYQLIREDAVGPLRDAVKLYRANTKMRDGTDVVIYTDVHIVGITCSSHGPAFRVEFSCERAGRRIQWNCSNRLRQGSIVALSPVTDNFRSSCTVAVVGARPLQGLEHNPPQIDLFWGDPNEAEFDPHTTYIMIEARTGYYEASRHMLVAMQKLMTESFPLQEHLVRLRASIDPPKFVQRKPIRDLSSLIPVAKRSEDEPWGLGNVDVLGKWPVSNGTQLDPSQMDAVQRIITKKLAIVQGPPGTGKTFVSTSALKIMLHNWSRGDPPIVIAAQTNHALDQLLTQVASDEPNFIRLGGGTAADNLIVKERTMQEVRTRGNHAGSGAWANFRACKKVLNTTAQSLVNEIKKAMMQGVGEAENFLEYGIITEDQYRSITAEDWAYAGDPELHEGHGKITYWVGRDQMMPASRCPKAKEGNFGLETLEESELEGGRNDEGDTGALTGPWDSYGDIFVGHHTANNELRSKRYLSSLSDLWEVPTADRGEVYHFMRQRLKLRMLPKIRRHMMEYKLCVQRLKVVSMQGGASIIAESNIKLIGCTTTGLSKYRGLLASLKPRTMLIEEAAETLEGTILAAMFESLQQLILIGDHQQLRAKCDNSVLAQAPYNLGVSMFERLVNNGIEYTMLNEQRRMIPQIRALLDPFYPNLKDHISVLDRVKNRPPVPGMGGRNAYAFHHQWPESRDGNSSRSNEAEAMMIAGFFAYLVRNGVDSSKITVLTYYTGQRNMIIRKLRAQPGVASRGPFNVLTVDSYQGEENDIIILSLVRSNDKCKIGFLENKNRAVVALSRARRGLFIFGDFYSLTQASDSSKELWGTVAAKLLDSDLFHIDKGFVIVCDKHGDERVIQTPSEWKNARRGCGAICGERLSCGHMCPHSCHSLDHDEMLCKEKCLNRRDCGHQCTGMCGDPCRCPCTSQTGRLTETSDDGEVWCLEDLLSKSAGPLESKPSLVEAIAEGGIPIPGPLPAPTILDVEGAPELATEGFGSPQMSIPSTMGDMYEDAMTPLIDIGGGGPRTLKSAREDVKRSIGTEYFEGASSQGISSSSAVEDASENGHSRGSAGFFEDGFGGSPLLLPSCDAEDVLDGAGGSEQAVYTTSKNFLEDSDSPRLPPNCLQPEISVSDSGVADIKYNARKWREWSDLTADAVENGDVAVPAGVAQLTTSQLVAQPDALAPTDSCGPRKYDWVDDEEDSAEKKEVATTKLPNVDSVGRHGGYNAKIWREWSEKVELSETKEIASRVAEASFKPQMTYVFAETYRSVGVRQLDESTAVRYSRDASLTSQSSPLHRLPTLVPSNNGPQKEKWILNTPIQDSSRRGVSRPTLGTIDDDDNPGPCLIPGLSSGRQAQDVTLPKEEKNKETFTWKPDGNNLSGPASDLMGGCVPSSLPLPSSIMDDFLGPQMWSLQVRSPPSSFPLAATFDNLLVDSEKGSEMESKDQVLITF